MYTGERVEYKLKIQRAITEKDRKVQKTGGSTLIVSLPKKWTEDTGIKAGSQIKLMNQPDGSLVINPSLDVSENIKDVKVLESSQEKSSHLFSKFNWHLFDRQY